MIILSDAHQEEEDRKRERENELKYNNVCINKKREKKNNLWEVAVMACELCDAYKMEPLNFSFLCQFVFWKCIWFLQELHAWSLDIVTIYVDVVILVWLVSANAKTMEHVLFIGLRVYIQHKLKQTNKKTNRELDYKLNTPTEMLKHGFTNKKGLIIRK